MDTCSQAFSCLNEVVSNHALNQAIEGFTLGFQDESLVLSLGCPLKSPNPIENTKRKQRYVGGSNYTQKPLIQNPKESPARLPSAKCRRVQHPIQRRGQCVPHEKVRTRRGNRASYRDPAAEPRSSKILSGTFPNIMALYHLLSPFSPCKNTESTSTCNSEETPHTNPNPKP